MSAYDVLVVGAGAAGMMAAGRAAELGKRTLLIEKNAEVGKKLAITGGGRCNILNAEDDIHTLLSQYGESGKFLYSPFSQFGMEDAYRFFERRDLTLKVEARKRAFPQSERAKDVVTVLKKYLAEGRVEIRMRQKVDDIVASGNAIERLVVNGRELSARSYVLATGGLSHPETGSSGDGFAWLRSLGIPVEEPTPTIVPLRTLETWPHKLAGISLPDVKLTFFVDQVRAFSLRGSVLCTHFGISGPTVLNAAGKVADLLEEGDVTIRIDTQPEFDLGLLDKKITSLFDANKNKLLKNVFGEIAPKGTAFVLLSLAAEIDSEKRVHSVTKEDRRRLAELLKSLPLSITGLMGFDRAVLADGGVPLTEIDTRTFATKKYKNLFVTGDLLHIRRPSGGYSLQLAWTSGYVAGSHA